MQGFWLISRKPMRRKSEVGACYWTVPAPDIVNSGQEEQGLVLA